MLNITLLMLIGSATMTAGIATSVDPGIQYQTWEGFGTSLCWWAHIIGGYPEPLRTTLVDKVIGDLKLNILRYNIGGGEAPGLTYMEPRACVPGYLGVDGKYDWNADAAQRWVLAHGIKLGANKFEAFSNSPPYFMTISGSVTGAVGGGDNLKPDQMDSFTSYLTTVVKHFHDKWGVKFETLDPMNEPGANWWTHGNRQEGCHMSPGAVQSALVVSTAKALAAAKLPTRVSASDESFNSWAVTSWDALTPEAKDYVLRLNTHCYGGASQHWVNHRAVRDNKRLWMSEYGDGDASGMQTAHQMITDLRVMMPSAWVYWQVIDGGSGWGCIDLDLNHNAKTYTVNRKYYTFAQFSRYIHPGAKFIHIEDANSVCVQNGSQVVIVTVNDTAQSASYDLSKFTKIGSTVAVTQTSATENLATLPSIKIANKAFSADLPAKSVTTFVINGCSYSGGAFAGFQTLASKKTDALLDVPDGSWTEGQFLTTSTPSGSFSQQWRVEGAGSGWYKLCNRDTGMYAALWDSAQQNYPALQWEDNGDTTLPWTLNAQSDGTYQINPYRYPAQLLTENQTRGNGWADVAIYAPYGGKEQAWAIRNVAPLYPNPPQLLFASGQ